MLWTLKSNTEVEKKDSPGERTSKLKLDITCSDPRIQEKDSKTHTLI